MKCLGGTPEHAAASTVTSCGMKVVGVSYGVNCGLLISMPATMLIIVCRPSVDAADAAAITTMDVTTSSMPVIVI